MFNITIKFHKLNYTWLTSFKIEKLEYIYILLNSNSFAKFEFQAKNKKIRNKEKRFI